MLHIITLLCLLLTLYNSSSPAATDQRFLQQVCLEVHLHGAQAATEKLQSDLPSLLSQAGIEVPEATAEVPYDVSPEATAEAAAETPNGVPPEAAAEATAEAAAEATAEAAAEAVAEAPYDVSPEAAAEAPNGVPPDEVSAPPEIDTVNLNYEEELKKLGFYKDETSDSKLNLRNAVLRFQSSCNLTATGSWDDKCLSSLTMQLLTGSAACDDLIESPPTESKWITINKTKRILTFYENKKVLQKYPVAIGNPPSLTPNGKFSIVSKVINPAWGGGGYAKPVKGGVPQNPLGYRWMGLSYKDGDTLGIHGNNSPYSIGKNVSHGCIRMINTDVEQLFTVVPRSAPVWIGMEEKLKEWGIEQPEYSLPAEAGLDEGTVLK